MGNGAKCIENARNLFHNKELKNELARYSSTQFQRLTETVTKLEKYDITPRDSLLVIQNIKNKLGVGRPGIDLN